MNILKRPKRELTNNKRVTKVNIIFIIKCNLVKIILRTYKTIQSTRLRVYGKREQFTHDERECQKNRKQNGQQERIYQANYKRQEQSN